MNGIAVPVTTEPRRDLVVTLGTVYEVYQKYINATRSTGYLEVYEVYQDFKEPRLSAPLSEFNPSGPTRASVQKRSPITLIKRITVRTDATTTLIEEIPRSGGTETQVHGGYGLVLFDLMTHTKGCSLLSVEIYQSIPRNSGVGDFGNKGIATFVLELDTNYPLKTERASVKINNGSSTEDNNDDDKSEEDELDDSRFL
ncbi:hypothetical protein DFH09DRAFT_1096332 [Mycena vulgaris]|nr:hypothetical protein DFH09DRAFT_1096332 [Mycena vulgaris]